jgi:hypothetical protein
VIGSLVSLISLEVTARLIQRAGLIAMTLTIAGASNASPIVVETQDPHPFTRPAHAIISGVGGNAAANGLWIMTPVDPTHLSLSTFDPQGNIVLSAGTGVYTSGGIAQIAFPDGSILLGRVNIAKQTAVTTPRIVFVPKDCPAWLLAPYGGVIPPPTTPARRSAQTAEQGYMYLNRQLNTERVRFEVHVTGAGDPPSSDFGDFDATQALYHILYGVMFDKITPDRARVLGGRWASQDESAASLTTRGQKWIGMFEIEMPVVANPLQFAPDGTAGEIDVNFAGGVSTDTVVINLPPVTP